MRSPNATMDPGEGQRQSTMAHINETRKAANKAVRISFGPDSDTYIPPREESPEPLSAHHRSFTSVEPQQKGDIFPPLRPNSSSGENTPSPVPDTTLVRPGLGIRPTGALQRAKSDYGPRSGLDKRTSGEDDDFAMRHGWQEEYTSSEYLKILHSVRLRSYLSKLNVI
jgi:regulatory associated protein of mTOR